MDVIDVIGPAGGVVQIDGDRIAAIILSEANCTDRQAARATLKIIRYLIEVITIANAAKTQ